MLEEVTDVNKEKVEVYTMVSNMFEIDGPQDHERDQTIVVKRMNLTFNEKDCQVLNFTDITTYKLLKSEKEKSHLLSTLNTSVHHEMLSPLKTNVEFSERLIRALKDQP